MFYIVTENKEYLIRDKNLTNSITTNINAATPFATQQGAKNYIKSCIQKKFRNKYSIIEVKEKTSKKVKTVSGERIRKRNLKGLNPEKLILENEELKPIFEEINSFMKAFQVFSETLKNLEYIKQFAEEHFEKLQDYQSVIDSALSDLDHFAENSHCNASDGYKFWLMQHTLEEKRRNIKDFYALFKQINEKFSSYKYTDHKKFIENIGEEKRNYAPKVLKELF